MKTPWKAIFTSVPMWALIIVHCGQNWGYWTLITELPTYMNDVLEYNLVDVSKKFILSLINFVNFIKFKHSTIEKIVFLWYENYFNTFFFIKLFLIVECNEYNFIEKTRWKKVNVIAYSSYSLLILSMYHILYILYQLEQ